MTHCSDLIRAALAAFALSSPASGQVADAWGLFDPASDPHRATWSGQTSDGPVAPGAPDRILFLLGPKSIVAGKEPGHAVGLVLDSHGNMVADGTSATITLDGTEHAHRTTDGIADRLFQPGPVARVIEGGIGTAERQSPRALVQVVPDLASTLPSLVTADRPFAPEQFFELQTPVLTDQFGNVAPDGTALTTLLAHANGSHSQGTALVTEGTADVRFLSRDIEGPASATLSLGANGSDPDIITLREAQPVGQPGARVETLPDIAAARVTVGPFMTTDGYTLTDGADVRLTLHLQNGTLQENGWIRDGYVTLLFPLPADADILRVTALTRLGQTETRIDPRTGPEAEIME